MQPRLGKRIRALREASKLSQADLARIFGLKDQQSVSAIETGIRRMTADEILLAVEKLGASFDYFTDPFLLAGEGRFSWRQNGADPESLEAYERKAGRWIGAYRHLAAQAGCPGPLLRRSLAIAADASPRDVMRAGERFAEELGLGKVPAARLAELMEREFHILVLMVDAEPGISGAACRLPELDAVLIARHELPGRRHFDLAHELFHILTWDTMPPEHAEAIGGTSGKRAERLANAFAASVLMPAAVVQSFGPWSGLSGERLIARLNPVADEMQVSASALRWRLVELGEINRAAAREISEAALHMNGRAARTDVPPARFSRRFMEIVALALEQDRLAVERAIDLLDLGPEDLEALFAAHGVECTKSLQVR
ncbi:MAG: XRE family transcriptional regulator [Rhodospirillales bacterium]|nr:XRE family transcriptional regulator [Rhodospirillales bacterium]